MSNVKNQISNKPHYVVIQFFDRTSQFFNLSDFRMKEILQNHYETIEKHSEKLSIETIYSLGTGTSEYVQIARFKPEDIVLFHEFMNDLAKINSPFLNLKETTTGVSGIGDYWLEQLKDIDIKEVPMSQFSKSRWGYKA